MNPSVVQYQRTILHALQSHHIYAGTVPPKVIAQRRRRNKAARIARRAIRRG